MAHMSGGLRSDAKRAAAWRLGVFTRNGTKCGGIPPRGLTGRGKGRSVLDGYRLWLGESQGQ